MKTIFKAGGVLLFGCVLLCSGAENLPASNWIDPAGVDSSHPFLLSRSVWLRVEEPLPEHLKGKEKKPEGMKIVSAVYGTHNDSQFKDVKQIVEDNILKNNGVLKLNVSNSVLTDPAFGQGKRLKVVYIINGEELTESLSEGSYMELPKVKPDYLTTNRPKMLARPRWLRRDFTITQKPVRAYLYAASLGLCELRLNGSRIAITFPSQESLNYTNSVPLHCFDVSSLIRQGANTIGAVLSNGRYCGLIHGNPSQICAFGHEPHLRAQLEIHFGDGTTQVVATDHQWQGCYQGPLVYSGVLEGEIYDATKEMPGWDQPGYQYGPQWGGALINRLIEYNHFSPQKESAISIARRKPSVAVKEPKSGVFVFDLGESVTGYPELLVNGMKGQEITLHCHERLNDDGSVAKEKLVQIENSLEQSRFLQYRLNASGKVCLTPHFFCTRFRYVEVDGLSEKPDQDALKAVVVKLQP